VIDMAKDLYTSNVSVVGGRDGRATSDDGKLALTLGFPKALGGSGEGTNPEQLFAAGFGACFASSLAFAAKGMGLSPGAVSVNAQVTLTVDQAGAYGIKAELVVPLPDLSAADAERVIAEARRICAYSNALNGKAEVHVTRA
jgi:Ohr subfamily peroxiredoxin